MAATAPEIRETAQSSGARRSSPVVTEDDLAGLPPPVKRYMTNSRVVGKAWVDTVHVRYQGRFRLATDKPWMSIRANQVYTVNPPGFLWKARFKMYGLPLIFGTDVYKAGRGHMHGTLAGLFTVVDGQGEEVDQGSMVRYLQETTWFPMAYLGENYTWTAVDDHAADVTLHDGGKSVTGRMYFDDAGRMLSFAAQRYGEFNGSYLMRTWAAPTTEYGVFEGMSLPVAGMGVWQLPAGDFAYVDVRPSSIEYNQAIESF